MFPQGDPEVEHQHPLGRPDVLGEAAVLPAAGGHQAQPRPLLPPNLRGPTPSQPRPRAPAQDLRAADPRVPAHG